MIHPVHGAPSRGQIASIALVLALSATVLYLGWLPLSTVHGYFSDDAVFLLLADYFRSPGTRDELLLFIRENSQFPVLFPLLLGLFGGGADEPLLAAAINRSLHLIALCVAAVFILRAGGRVLACLGLLFVLCLPSTSLFALELWSEFLFMALLYGALLAAEQQHEDRWWLPLLASLVVLACLTRAAGISLLLALWLWLLLQRAPRRWTLIGASGLVVGLSLMAASGRSNALWYLQAGSDIGVWQALPGLLPALLERLHNLTGAWNWQFQPAPALATTGLLSVAGLLTLAAALAGWLMRLAQSKLDALWLGAYLGMVLLWPFQEQVYLSRFLYPAMPLLLFYALCWLPRLPRPAATVAAAGLVLATGISSGPTLVQFGHRLLLPTEPELQAFTANRWWLLEDSDAAARQDAEIRRDVVLGLQAARQWVAPDDCVYAAHPPLVALHTRRLALRYSPVPPDRAPPEAGFPRCRSLIASPMLVSDRVLPPYFPAGLMDLDRHRVSTLPDRQARHAILLVQAD